MEETQKQEKKETSQDDEIMPIVDEKKNQKKRKRKNKNKKNKNQNQQKQETQPKEQVENAQNDTQINNLMKQINDESIFQQEPNFEAFDNIINQLSQKMKFINEFMDDLSKEKFSKLQELNMKQEEQKQEQQEQPTQKLSAKQKEKFLTDIKTQIAKLQNKEKSLSELKQKENNQSFLDDIEKLTINLRDDIEQKKEFQKLIESIY